MPRCRCAGPHTLRGNGYVTCMVCTSCCTKVVDIAWNKLSVEEIGHIMERAKVEQAKLLNTGGTSCDVVMPCRHRQSSASRHSPYYRLNQPVRIVSQSTEDALRTSCDILMQPVRQQSALRHQSVLPTHTVYPPVARCVTLT